MPVACACPISPTAADRRVLVRRAGGHKTSYRDRVRARIVLDAAAGYSNAAIASECGVGIDTVRKWRTRFAAEGMAGLRDRPRSGRPTVFTPVQVAEVKALACQRPAAVGAPFARWSCPELARHAVQGDAVQTISASTVRRWLTADAIKPWQYRSWIFPRDPDFTAKASTVLDLYAGIFDGEPLGADDYVISADEKTSIQARCRCHPTLPPGKARTMRVNHDYDRGGALAYLAAYDTTRAKLFGRCENTTGIAAFTRLVDQVMATEPYASAKRVFWIVDNGSSHRGRAAIDRLVNRHPNAVMVHTPVHASWLNQIEIVFSVIQRKVVSPNDFTDLDQIQTRLTDFEHHYNATAQPFGWNFTKRDLKKLLTKIDNHQQAALEPSNAA